MARVAARGRAVHELAAAEASGDRSSFKYKSRPMWFASVVVDLLQPSSRLRKRSLSQKKPPRNRAAYP
jgi:hypothetical protein